MTTGAEPLALAPLPVVTRALRAGEVSAREAVSAALAQVERFDDTHRVFITLLAEQALARADALDATRSHGQALGPLHGVPFAVKDCFELAGVPMTCGSGHRRDAISQRTAPPVRALEQAGAIVLGTVNLHEWAFGATSSNPHFGNVVTPWGEQLIPGGSSGSSAVAVALGMGYFALGTDTGGSIRLPASYCGVAGLKVTTGAVSTTGCHPLSWTMDTVGPLARRVIDLELPFETIALTGQTPPRDPRAPRGLAGARLGILAGDLDDETRTDPGVLRSLRSALQRLERAGCRVCELKAPSLARVPAAQAAIVFSEGATVHSGPLRAERRLYGQDVQQLLALGDTVPARDYIAAHRFRAALYNELKPLFERVDFIVSPTTPNRAPPIGTDTVTWPGGSSEPLLDACIRYLVRWSFSGLPALSMPCGLEDGLPVGLQLAARPGGEHALLTFGREAEQELDWLFPAPPVA